MDGWLLYGANGYTGRLIAEEAVSLGMRPVLAGRSIEPVRALAEGLGLEHRAFDLASPSRVAENLRGVGLVLHCAGPFSRTLAPMLEACLLARAHYLDITGEVEAFEALFARSSDLEAAGVVGVSGIGFDVVPSDCLAALLRRELPTAVRLRLGVAGLGGGVSRGTARTALEILPRGGLVRKGGHLVRVPLAHRVRRVPFGKEPILAATFPWGDVATAHRSTGILDVEVYLPASPVTVLGLRLLGAAGPLLGLGPVRGLLGRAVAARAAGPDEAARRTGGSVVWGEVEDDQGGRVEMRLRGPEPYAFTVAAALAAVERALGGGLGAGALTPSLAFGADFAPSLPGVALERLA